METHAVEYETVEWSIAPKYSWHIEIESLVIVYAHDHRVENV